MRKDSITIPAAAASLALNAVNVLRHLGTPGTRGGASNTTIAPIYNLKIIFTEQYGEAEDLTGWFSCTGTQTFDAFLDLQEKEIHKHRCGGDGEIRVGIHSMNMLYGNWDWEMPIKQIAEYRQNDYKLKDIYIDTCASIRITYYKLKLYNVHPYYRYGDENWEPHDKHELFLNPKKILKNELLRALAINPDIHKNYLTGIINERPFLVSFTKALHHSNGKGKGRKHNINTDLSVYGTDWANLMKANGNTNFIYIFWTNS